MYRAVEDVTGVLKKSRGRTILILKHSSICPVSARGKSEVDKFLESGNPGLEAYLVVVQKDRPVSKELAQALGVRHQSPQALVVRDGKALKVLNHYQIKLDNLKQAVSESMQIETDNSPLR